MRGFYVKQLICVLAFLYISMLSHPVWSMVFKPTDLDIDFSLVGDLNDPEAFFAVVTPDAIDVAGVLSGGAIAVPAPIGPVSGEIKVVDFPAPFASAADPVGFEVGLFYEGHWEKPTAINYTGGDTWIFDWAPDDWNGETATLLMSDIDPVVTAVPVPAAAWLFASGLLGIVGVARRGSTLS